MKWIRPSMVWMGFFAFSFLFAGGQEKTRDTLPENSTVKQLPTVLLRRQASMGSASGDTLIFDAQRYARPTAFRLEELLETIPGFRVDGEGRIYFNGKEISRIMLDGDDLAGERYKLVSRNLRSMMVEKVELIQHHHQNPLMKDFELSAAPAINIRIKKAYKGRATGSGSVGMGPSSMRHVEAESVLIKDSLKQMIFLDHNNTGANGVKDQLGNTDQDDVATVFDVHPFPFVLPQQPLWMAVGQSSRNNDLGLSSLSSFKMLKGFTINLAASVGKHHWQEQEKVHRTILQKDSEHLQLMQGILKQRTTEEIGLRMGWENARNKNLFVKSILRFAWDQPINHHAEARSGFSAYQLDVQNLEKHWRLQWDKESTRKLGERFFLQQEYRIAIGQLSATTSLNRFKAEDNPIGVHLTNQFNKRGILLMHHLAWLVSKGSIKWKWGWRSSFEKSHSLVSTDRMAYHLLKTYPYAEMLWSPNKRLILKTQGAGGLLLTGERLLKLQSVYMLEQELQLKFKRMLHFEASAGIAKKTGDLQDLFSGSFLTRDGIFIQGNQQLNLPSTFHFKRGGAQVDLHAGRSWSLVLQYRNQFNEMVNAMLLNKESESWQQVLSGSRHTWALDLQAEQYILFLKSKIRLNLNESASFLPQFVNGMHARMFMRNSLMDWRIIHPSRHKLGWEIQYHHLINGNQLMKDVSSSRRIQQNTLVTKLWWQFSKKTSSSFSYGRMFFGNGHGARMIDMSWNTDISRQFKISLNGQNLLDQKVYQLLIADGFGITTIDQQLNGRRILFTARFLF